MKDLFEKDYLKVSNLEGGAQSAVPKFNMRYKVVAEYWWSRGYNAALEEIFEKSLAKAKKERVEERVFKAKKPEIKVTKSKSGRGKK